MLWLRGHQEAYRCCAPYGFAIGRLLHQELLQQVNADHSAHVKQVELDSQLSHAAALQVQANANKVRRPSRR